MQRKKRLNLLLTFTTLGFWAGFFFSFQQLRQAVVLTSANHYIDQGMTGLVAELFRGPIVKWFSYVIIALLLAIIGFAVWNLLLKKIVKIGFHFQIVQKEKIKTAIAVLLSLVFLFYGELIVNGDLATPELSMTNVLLNIGILFLTYGLWILLTKTKWDRLFRVFNFKNLARFTLVPTALLLIINGVFIINPFQGSPSGPNIILVVVDCLRADHLGCYGYKRATSPNIDRLAQKSTLFAHPYSNAPWTKPSVASLFTSLYPNQHGAVTASDTLDHEILTLAEILKNDGYKTWFFNGGNPVVGAKFNFYQGFKAFESVNRAGILTDQFLNEISGWENRKDDRFFAYLHYMDLHLPFHKNKYNNYFSSPIANPFLAPGYINRFVIRNALAEGKFSEKDRHDLEAIYDGQIKYVDDALGKLVDSLRKKDLLDNTVIIFTADHGEELWDHQNFEHGHSLYNELLHIPLIIYGQSFKATTLQTQVSLVDIMPTIMSLAGLESRGLDIQGNNIRKLRERPVFATGTLYNDRKFCLIKDGVKLIVNTGVPVRPLIGAASNKKHELYNLTSDPEEQQSLELQMPRELAALQKELQKFISLVKRLSNKKISLDQDKELKEKLKSLGYL